LNVFLIKYVQTCQDLNIDSLGGDYLIG